MRLVFLALSLLVVQPGFANNCDTEVLTTYSDILTKYADYANTTSVVWFDKSDFCSLHIGKLSATATSKVNDNSIYQIASLSKIFTGMLASSLAATDRIDLNQSVHDILQINNDELSNISLREVLHHRAGLPRNSGSIKRVDGEPLRDPLTKQKLTNELENVSLDGSKPYEYSNLGYAALALMLEKATGELYSDLLTKNVLAPLSLSHTSIKLPADKSNLVQPYRKDDKDIPTDYWDAGYLTAASALYSSPKDVAKLAQMLMNCQRERCDNYDVFSSSMRVDGNREYGFGINKDMTKLDDNQYPFYYHSGDMDGFAGLVFISPLHQQGIVILTSRGGKWKNQFQSELIKALLSQRLDN